jgi:potassium efflux system protein
MHGWSSGRAARGAVSGLARHRSLAAIVLCTGIWLTITGAAETSADIDLSPTALRKALANAERAEAPTDVIQKQVVTLYREALDAVNSAERYKAEAELQNRRAADGRRLVQGQRLRAPSEPRGVRIPSNATSAQVLQILAEVHAESDARHEYLAELDRLAERQKERRSEIAKRVGNLNQAIYRIDAAAGSVREETAHPAIRQATLVRQLAQRKAAEAEVAALREEVANYDVQARVLPLQRDLAQRRAGEIAAVVREVEELASRLTAAEAASYLSAVHHDCDKVISKFPQLRDTAVQVKQYAEQLAGQRGAQRRGEELRRSITALRNALNQLRTSVQLTKRRFEAARVWQDIPQWLADFPEGLPTIGELDSAVQDQAFDIAQTEQSIAVLRDARARDSELPGLGGTDARARGSAELASRVAWLLDVRREVQTRLLAEQSRSLSLLLELNAISRTLLAEEQAFADYLRERILWVRSVAALPEWKHLREAFGWLFLNADWPRTLQESGLAVLRSPVLSILIAAAVSAMLILRRHLTARLVRQGRSAAARGSLGAAAAALITTLLLAAPVPAVLMIASVLISAGSAAIAPATGGALTDVAILAFGLCFILEMVRPHGLAETFLQMPPQVSTEVRRILKLFTPILLLLVFVCLSFGRHPIDYVRPANDVALANSLGRAAFIGALLTVYAAAYRLLRPRGIVASALATTESGRLPGGRFLLPIGSAAMLSAAALAIAGYYLTVLVLVRLTVATAIAGGVVFLITVTCMRWSRLSSDRRLSKVATDAAEEVQDDTLIAADETAGIEKATEDATRFFRFSAALAFVTISVFIWSDVLPSFRVLQRVQLWPEMAVLNDKDFAASVAATPREGPPAAEGTADAAAKATTPGGRSPTANPAQLKVPPATGSKSSSISLADVVTALLIVVGTIILARNLPGLLQFALQRPVPNSGDRNAISTIIKYLFITAGTGAALRQFGLQWSQIQWIAAAFSFGLAFGLQEVFANFVSGVIILVERPMAIGDFCRFGTNLGTIESIGLRSTRVRAPDRTIITVPNAEFSKREVVNYAKRDRMLIQATLCLRYDTSEDQLRFLLVKLWELLIAHPAIFDEDARVRFCGFGTHSLDIEVFAYADCRDYARFLGIREDVFLRTMEIVKQAGTDFALPSQTTYIARDSGLDSERREAAESEIAGSRADRTLPLPEFPETRRRAIRNTIDFPCSGTYGQTASTATSGRK